MDTIRKILIITIVFILLFPYFSIATEPINQITLMDASALAIKTDERIKIAEKEIIKSRLLPKKAISVMLPSMTVEGGYNEASEEVELGPYIVTSDTPGVGPFEIAPTETNIISHKNAWKGEFEFLQPVYKASFFPLKRQADKAIDSSIENYYQTVQDISFQVERVYYDILKTKALVLNAEEVQQLANEELEIATVKFEAGHATEDIVFGAELYVTGAERKLIEYQNDLRLAKDALKNLIGIDSINFDVVKPPMLTARSIDHDTLVNIAFENRHDYKISILNVALAKSEVDIVKTRFHPSIQGTWNYYRSDNETISRDREYWVAAVTMKVPIFEGSSRFWDLKEKKEALSQARFAMDATKKKVRIQVKEAMLHVENFESVLRNLEKQVKLAQKSYDIILTQFEYGSATSLYLNQALTALDSAKTEFINETYDYQIALIKLEKAIGLCASDYINGINNIK